MDNLEAMDKFLEMYNLPRLNQEETENMNRLITSNEFESVIPKLSANRSPEPDGFLDKFYQTFKEKLTLTLLKLFQKISEEGTLPNSSYELSITLIAKTKTPHTCACTHTRTHTQLQDNIIDEHR